jgi:SAM-dependent methyltransferase
MSIKEIIKAYKFNKYQRFREDELLTKFYHDFTEYNILADKNQKAYKEFLFPCLYDNTGLTDIDPTYFYQDTWAFERILLQKPSSHIDIGSHHKFAAFISKITNLTMIDLRPLSLAMDSIHFKKGDILNLPFDDECIESLSSLCVIEHIGLGRYGDKLDPNGSWSALKEITRVLKKKGHLYISVPVSDKNITAFNAGRIFDVESFLQVLETDYTINDKKFIVQSKLQEYFEPHDKFGTTMLLELTKK